MNAESQETTIESTEPVQRHLDRLRGFAYLESFDELQRWTERDVDPLARSNTPLLERSASPDTPPVNAAKVMLIHDYKGGYNPYEACQGATTDKDMYSCEYLQHVETFVYFSHKLVTIPPPTWVNTCHRNGVLCLGTFIVEPGSKGVECILEEDSFGSFWVAHQLALIAEKYGFDGWLVNIEASFPLLSWSVDKMECFLLQLRRELGIRRRVVWYDALTTLNFVWYQNTLNSLNLTFARAAGSILTNYAWNPQLATSAKHLAEKSELGIGNVYFGIDVWAQNVQKGRNRRVTFPVEGGGGTGTGLGLQALKELGLGAGVFAPGWSFEHFATNCRAVERSVWLGEELIPNLACECCPDRPHQLVPYRQNGITKHAARYPSGSRTFFHTDFTRALTPAADHAFFADIGSQSVLPLPGKAMLMSVLGTSFPSGNDVYYVSNELRGAPARLEVSTYISQEDVSHNRVAALLPLFDLYMSEGITYELSASFLYPVPSVCALALVVEYSGSHHHRIDLPNEGVSGVQEVLPPREDSISGVFLSVVCQDTRQLPRGKIDLLDLHSIIIQPLKSVASCIIAGLRLEQRGEAETRHHRLVWKVNELSSWEFNDFLPLPVSDITGSCAYFVVEIDGSYAGRAYTLEFVISGHTVQKSRQVGSMDVQITAAGFDGRTLAKIVETLHWPTGEDDWVLVTSEDVAG